MYTFNEYKKLPKEIKAMATSLWVSEIQYLSGCDKLNRLPEKLQALEKTNFDLAQQQKNNTWYNYSAKRVLSDIHLFNRIGKLFPAANELLLHPLWFLLDCDKTDHTSLILIARGLSPETSNRILERKDGTFRFKKIKKSICYENSLDAMVASLLLYFDNEFQAPETILQVLASTDIFRCFLRLFALRYRFKLVNRLYQTLSDYFPTPPPSNLVLTAKNHKGKVLTELHFPTKFNNCNNIENSISIYRLLMEGICENLGILNFSDKLKFASCTAICMLSELDFETKETLKRKITFLHSYQCECLRMFNNYDKTVKANDSWLKDAFAK